MNMGLYSGWKQNFENSDFLHSTLIFCLITKSIHLTEIAFKEIVFIVETVKTIGMFKWYSPQG